MGGTYPIREQEHQVPHDAHDRHGPHDRQGVQGLLQAVRVFLPSDCAALTDHRYAKDENKFFDDFSAAYAKYVSPPLVRIA